MCVIPVIAIWIVGTVHYYSSAVSMEMMHRIICPEICTMIPTMVIASMACEWVIIIGYCSINPAVPIETDFNKTVIPEQGNIVIEITRPVDAMHMSNLITVIMIVEIMIYMYR